MTRRNLTPLLGAACATLTLLIGGTACGSDEAAAPPRTVAPTDRAAADRSTASDDDDGDGHGQGDDDGDGQGDDEALCEALEDVEADARALMAEGTMLDLIETYEQLIPHADEQMRDDIRLMLSVMRAAIEDGTVSPEQSAAATEAIERITFETQRRCGGLGYVAP